MTAQSSEKNPMQYVYLILKIVVFVAISSVLYMSEVSKVYFSHHFSDVINKVTFQVFFEKVFVTRPWKALFVTTDDDIREWWFRWRLDRYRYYNCHLPTWVWILTFVSTFKHCLWNDVCIPGHVSKKIQNPRRLKSWKFVAKISQFVGHILLPCWSLSLHCFGSFMPFKTRMQWSPFLHGLHTSK